MPELPEVETVVRQLAETLPSRRIQEVEILHSDLLREPSASFRRGLLGSSFLSVARRGKNIVLRLSPAQVLAVNLGMTGQLLLRIPLADGEAGESPPPGHTGLRFNLDPEGYLIYADVRRFGCLRRFAPEDWEAAASRLGPEPLDPQLTPESFHRALARSRAPLRSWLLDQSHIAGIGNIYAAEALFRAGVHPARQARSLEPPEAEGLLRSLREVLGEAIRARGTTLRDYRTAAGDRGDFGPSLLAYGREGRPCVRCNTPIRRIVFGNRSAFYCPGCQILP